MGLKLYTESSGSNRKLNIKYVEILTSDEPVAASMLGIFTNVFPKAQSHGNKRSTISQESITFDFPFA